MTPTITVNRAELRKLVHVELSAEWEETDPEEYFEDPADVAYARECIQNGSVWGWADVTVKIELNGMSSMACVGGCSYESEADFKENGPFDDMVDVCVEELAQDIEKVINTHGVIDHDPIPCLWCAARP